MIISSIVTEAAGACGTTVAGCSSWRTLCGGRPRVYAWTAECVKRKRRLLRFVVTDLEGSWQSMGPYGRGGLGRPDGKGGPLKLNDLNVPVTPACRAAVDVATAYCSPELLNHSVRSYLWAAG